ncbi:hypothetical protein ZIOFF_074342 (mitochondrion) [Zingiber officinale]|uniref:Uncharacterized protein n=1 Tax=Zingiber officinale TaxID=94328 RepID=A0A8J5C6F6_ZINOF|nr:hypothetical protein ZIOFF_074342 [Zingiber officinale]
MPYHLAILQKVGPWGEGEGREGRKRAVQGRGDIASKQQGSPFRTDYNKLATATLIERNETVSSLLSLLAMRCLSKKVGERPLALVTQHANKEPWFCCALYSEATISRGPRQGGSEREVARASMKDRARAS